MGTSKTPTICLNMIVKNEAQIIQESLDSVAPYIDYWVIIDTGSNDGTQQIIRSKMAKLGIPGELHERPWHDFGHNRTEALELAQGHCDYILVNDADDVLVGTPDFDGLTADGYRMRMEDNDSIDFWQLHLFRDGLPWRYVGVTHEYATCDSPHTEDRLRGDYRILYRQLGSNSIGSNKLQRDLELLLAEVENHPEDERTTFYLARSYEWLGDHLNALRWFKRRTAMSGWEEEVYCAMFKVAEMMQKLGEPWSSVQDAYLRAWAYRPSRPEALNAIAFHYRSAAQYELGYLFASQAARIPFPEEDSYFFQDAHQWRALDEKAVCAGWTGRTAEALCLNRRLLTCSDLTHDDRSRILANRDLMARRAMDICGTHPGQLLQRPPARTDAEVTVSLTSGRLAREITERTLNSFLNCCTDSNRVGRFLVVDAGIGTADREDLTESYNFLDFIEVVSADLNVVRQQIGGRYWLHLWHGWRFFTEEALITRLTDVLESEPEVYQVGVNFGDAIQLSNDSPARSAVRVTPRGNRYVLSNAPTTGPAMFDMTRLNRALEATTDGALEGPTATLDEVLCVHAP